MEDWPCVLKEQREETAKPLPTGVLSALLSPLHWKEKGRKGKREQRKRGRTEKRKRLKVNWEKVTFHVLFISNYKEKPPSHDFPKVNPNSLGGRRDK